MKINIQPFRVREGGNVKLKHWATRGKPFYKSKTDYEEHLADHVRKMSQRHDLLYAQNRFALLLIFQAMDAAGKDGTIKHVMSGLNPQGCQVFSFKHPSPLELDHDFLWRTTRCLPERGRIGIFNRSYYEEVLVARVHPEIIAAQKLPDKKPGPDFWKHRFTSINDLEKHLYRNGTRIVKFFLHLSKEEQRQRFLARIDNADKNWKITHSDIAERQYWKQYTAAYEDCLAATSTRRAPWYVVPADDKENARLIVSQIVLDTLDSLKLSYPKPGPDHKKELQAIRKLLAK
jgi:PPK2 family polyphosphate:nucleotide phosphotransferase